MSHSISHPTPQGPDADDFNPDRFIDGNGDITSALADTKDGMFIRPYNVQFTNLIVEGQEDISFALSPPNYILIYLAVSRTCRICRCLFACLLLHPTNLFVGFRSQVFPSLNFDGGLSFDRRIPEYA